MQTRSDSATRSGVAASNTWRTSSPTGFADRSQYSNELVERGVLARALVATVCLDQADERIARKVARANGRGEPLQKRMLRCRAVEDPLEVLLEVVEEDEPVALDLVADLVDETRVAVDRGQSVLVSRGRQAATQR